MKYIQKSRIETFLKTKGYNIESTEINPTKSKNSACWAKSENEKVVVPKKEIISSDELSEIFVNENLLNEFRKY